MENMKILLVDDELSIRTVLSETLAHCGYDIETAESGTEAMQKFQSGRFAAVITDVKMPKANGMDLLRGVKK
ncbi:MAG: response regulator, partial [Syntrophales bacterium]